MELEYVSPKDIESRSFEIITQELKDRGIDIPEDKAFIIKRAIHTTADFEYAHTLCFSEDAVEKAEALLRAGADIVTDTNMALSGINKAALERLGGVAHCFMADAGVAAEAKERALTRAAVSMEHASRIPKPVIFAIGNAPTALISLKEMYDRGEFVPAFVIGVPVGFVNVEAAKEMIMETGIPFIVNRGRKGGSNVAAAIINAILYKLL